MATVYLSPSTQEYNPYFDGIGNEEYYMNLIADEMIPYLEASGINFYRNTPQMTAGSSIRQSNSLGPDLHVALHSNAAPPNLSGQLTGSDVYYFGGSSASRRAADIFVRNLKMIYPNPDKVRALTTTSIGEVTRTNAPAVLIEFAYHDNPQDAQWIRDNIGEIARNVSMSIAEYFGLQFNEPSFRRTGIVTLQSGYLNIRSMPDINADIIGRAYNGDRAVVLGQEGDWYVVRINGLDGFANRSYIRLE